MDCEEGERKNEESLEEKKEHKSFIWKQFSPNGGVSKRGFIAIPVINTDYITLALRSHHFASMVELKLFPDGKELTESFSVFQNVIRRLEKERKRGFVSNPSSVAIVIADGHLPRTAALFSFLTNWKVFTVDPLLKEKWSDKETTKWFTQEGNKSQEEWKEERSKFVKYCTYLKRTICLPLQVERVQWHKLEELRVAPLIAIVSVHSHTTFSTTWKSIEKLVPNDCAMIGVALECCYQQNLPHIPLHDSFVDFGVHSPARLIKIWSKNLESLKVVKDFHVTWKLNFERTFTFEFSSWEPLDTMIEEIKQKMENKHSLLDLNSEYNGKTKAVVAVRMDQIKEVILKYAKIGSNIEISFSKANEDEEEETFSFPPF